MNLQLHIDDLSKIPSDELNREGWGKLRAQLSKSRALVITHHERPDAVMLDIEAFDSLIALAFSKSSDDVYASLAEGIGETLSRTISADQGVVLLREVLNQLGEERRLVPSKLRSVDEPRTGTLEELRQRFDARLEHMRRENALEAFLDKPAPREIKVPIGPFS